MKKDSTRPGKFSMLCVAGLFAFAVSGNSAVAASRSAALTVNVEGDGWVSSDSDSIDCPSDCTESYNRISQVILSASPGPDSRFVGWEGACSGTQASCRLRIRRSVDVTALFESTVVPGSGDDSGSDNRSDTNDPAVNTIQIHWPVYSTSQ